MAFEATDSVTNLYLTSQCRAYEKPAVCTPTSSLAQSTRVRIYTTSAALADNSLMLSEITGMKIWLPIYSDPVAKAWEPGWIDLNLTTDTSGLVATKSADGWRLYSSAQVKPHTEKWCSWRCDEPGYERFDTAKISMAWFEILQVEVNRYSYRSVPDSTQFMFLSGPFIEMDPSS